VSHQPERIEKNCLNCGVTVIGRYCHVCGQENVVTKESFWSLAKHFAFDILHFDGKFFHTLKYLFVRPGMVAKEYCLGKRSSFLHPIRMYLFTSAVFFVVFASVNTINFGGDKGKSDLLDNEDRRELVGDYQQRLSKAPRDTTIPKIIALLKDTTIPLTGRQIIEMDPKPFYSISGNRYTSRREYDSAQKALPASKRDGILRQLLVRKAMNFNEKYKGRANEGAKILWESFVHRLPYMLFLSLPFFALILKLLYARRKNFYYSDHAIFTIYHYILSFILLLVIFALSALVGKFKWQILVYPMMLIGFAWPVYLWLQMKNFYGQGKFKTSVKFLLLNVLGFIVVIILFLLFLLLSIIEL
jgi:hypothetical protein